MSVDNITKRLTLLGVLVIIIGMASGIIIANNSSRILAAPGASSVEETQTIIGRGSTALDSESKPYEERLSSFSWNTKNSDKRYWPTVVFRKEMNDSARAFIKGYFSKSNASGKYLAGVSGYNAKDTLTEFAGAFRNTQIDKVNLRRIGYSSGRYKIIYGGSSQGPEIYFTMSMRGIDPTNWAVSNFLIVQK